MAKAWKGKLLLTKLRGGFLLTNFVVTCVAVLFVALTLLKVRFFYPPEACQEEKGDNYTYLFSNYDKSYELDCSTRLMYITVSGGINNQILATANALALAKYLNITVAVPTFSKLRTSRPVIFDPVPLSTYFDEKIFIDD